MTNGRDSPKSETQGGLRWRAYIKIAMLFLLLILLLWAMFIGLGWKASHTQAHFRAPKLS